MHFTLYRSQRHNCSHLTIAAMLKRLGFSVESIFNQSGLVVKGNSHKDFYITPYYKDIFEVIEENMGVKHKKLIFKDFDSVSLKIKEMLNNGQTISLKSDIFELPYCHHYQKQHDLHRFEIVGYDYTENLYEFCDHYFYHHGFISEETLTSAIESTRKTYNFNDTTIDYFEIDDSNKIKPQNDLFKVVAANYKHMIGDLDFKNTEDIVVVGLSGIETIKIIINDVFGLEHIKAQPYIDKLYRQFKEIGNSRYHFHLYLMLHNQKSTASKLLDAAQSWTVAANLIMHAYFKGEFDNYKQRVINRIDHICSQEQQNITAMQEFVVTV
ncbi:BtrH N-terminal domain-containing protein [Paenibacillus tyrfis]|uniref:BtrH N-terminal domain-containing protein n=1 Tax=Paenibacillus tyrfis TaxID=1501230 RepID=UPI00209FC321|nr:BtrH N-terminal domain-containing protein [Paenibacillus tyrfis]MCP1311558.1 BtrH N-terminal domain-containing protein [Paenibacillus tyrfis]